MSDGATGLVLVGLGRLGGDLAARVLARVSGRNVQAVFIDLEDALAARLADVEKFGREALGVALSVAQGRALLENPAEREELAPWLGDPAEWRDAVERKGEEAFRTTRRLGRLLLALAGPVLGGALRSAVAGLRGEGERTPGDRLAFHICADLGEGLAGGCLPELLRRLRRRWPETGDARLCLYALESGANDAEASARAYATLLELGGMATGGFRLADRQTTRARLEERGAASVCRLDATYFWENGSGSQLEYVAEILTRRLQSPAALAGALAGAWAGVEDAGRALPGFSACAATLLEVGAPVDSLPNALASELVAQAIGDALNPAATASGEAAPEIDAAFLDAVGLGEEQLVLSAPALAQDRASRRWKTFEEDWRTIVPILADLAREAPDRREWVATLVRLCDRRFVQDFRGVGVGHFFEARLKRADATAREMAGLVEARLLREIASGRLELPGAARVLDALIERLRGVIRGAPERAREMQARARTLEASIAKDERTWSSMGGLAGLFGRREALFARLTESLGRLYAARSRREGWLYAQTALPVIEGALGGLRAAVAEAMDRLTAVRALAEDEGLAGLERLASTRPWRRVCLDFAAAREVFRATLDSGELRAEAARALAEVVETTSRRAQGGLRALAGLDPRAGLRLLREAILERIFSTSEGGAMARLASANWFAGCSSEAVMAAVRTALAEAAGGLGGLGGQTSAGGNGLLALHCARLPEGACADRLKEALDEAARSGGLERTAAACPEQAAGEAPEDLSILSILAVRTGIPAAAWPGLIALRRAYDRALSGGDFHGALARLHVEPLDARPADVCPLPGEEPGSRASAALLALTLGLAAEDAAAGGASRGFRFIGGGWPGEAAPAVQLGERLGAAFAALEGGAVARLDDEVARALSCWARPGDQAAAGRIVDLLDRLKAEEGVTPVYLRLLDGAGLAEDLLASACPRRPF